MKRVMLLLAFSLSLIDPASALDKAVLKDVRGKVEVRETTGGWQRARVGMEISEGTYISTGFHASAVVDLGTSELLVKELTRMQLEELIEREGTVSTKLFLRVGRIGAKVKGVEGLRLNFTVRSTIATAAVRGTEFEFDGINLKTSEGTVFLINRVGQTRSVAAGESSSAPGFSLPTSAQEEREASVTVVADTSKPAAGVKEGGRGAAPLISTPPVVTTTDIMITIELP